MLTAGHALHWGDSCGHPSFADLIASRIRRIALRKCSRCGETRRRTPEARSPSGIPSHARWLYSLSDPFRPDRFPALAGGVMSDELDLILQSLYGTWLQVGRFAPRVLVAVLLLIVGWLIARTVQRAAVRVLRFLKLDVAAEHAGVEDFLVRGGVRLTTVTLIGQVLYWGLMLVFVLAVFNVLGLTPAPEFVDRFAGYVPNVVAALVVLVFGTVFAQFVRGLVHAYLNNVGMQGSGNISLLVHGALLAFVGILALEQLDIDVQLLTSAFQLAFGAVCLALALAFGLGGRTWAESLLDRAWRRR
jgi:hypothetical protein